MASDNPYRSPPARGEGKGGAGHSCKRDIGWHLRYSMAISS
jgi:hypothetical protein